MQRSILISLLRYAEKNLGPLKNGVDVRKHCSGKYLALLEGDDFWNEEDKLQRQVDFLENNKEYSLCFTGVNIIKDSNINIPYVKHDIVYTAYFEAEQKLFIACIEGDYGEI